MELLVDRATVLVDNKTPEIIASAPPIVSTEDDKRQEVLAIYLSVFISFLYCVSPWSFHYSNLRKYFAFFNV